MPPATTSGRHPGTVRTRRDLCPGVVRPWLAADGALVRVRLAGGLISPAQLAEVSDIARRFGDGDVHLTRRANLQLRSLPVDTDGSTLRPDVVDAIGRAGLLPSRTHDLVRNLMVSPQSGLAGGRADLRAVVAELETLLLGDAELAGLPGRFLFVLDDGRGDLLRDCDLGLVALDHNTAQLRVGPVWGPVLALTESASALHDLARRFVAARGEGSTAAWHIDELGVRLVEAEPADPRVPAAAPPLPYGPVPGGIHVPAPDGIITPDLASALASCGTADLVITPWRGVLVPETSR
ncbi:MAG: ferredoxin-nitrite reductase [Nocardioides sp.]|nr:ferredoxin-nitrite reductase [Nocardioides sp.]